VFYLFVTILGETRVILCSSELFIFVCYLFLFDVCLLFSVWLVYQGISNIVMSRPRHKGINES
jgi:hypothetical protein